MARTVYQSTLQEIRALTPSVRELTIRFGSPSGMPFEAGQFVMLHVPVEGKPPVKRAYSIASEDSKPGEIRLVIKLVPGGTASEYIRGLENGRPLELSGPFGKLTFRAPPTRQVVFLCTGAGISQHMSFLRSKCGAFPGTEYRLLFGVWNEEEMFYRERLDEAAKILPDFRYEYVLDKPTGAAWKGKTGHVTDHIENFGYLEKETTFYLCGNPAMIKSVKARLAEKGFPKERIFAEAFT